MERNEALKRINDLIQFANSALKEDCPYIGISEDDLTALLFASLDMELRSQGTWIITKDEIIKLFHKYDILLVHENGKIVPVKNSTKQECYNLLYEIQELIEWRKILLWKKNNL